MELLMNANSLRFALSLLPILLVSTCLAQEVIVQTDYSTKRAFDITYSFGGYGLHDDDEQYQVNDSVTSRYEELAEGGKDGACLTATLNASKLTIPNDVSYDYVGWACGSALDLKQAFKDADLSNYTISFDAKISGTQTLPSSKCFLQFLVFDDEDNQIDVVVRLERGEANGTNNFGITDKYQSFSFNLKDDMKATIGAVEDLAKHEVKMISVMVQAQGMAWNIGKDADNVLYVDNIKLTKGTEVAEVEEMKQAAQRGHRDRTGEVSGRPMPNPFAT